MGSNGEIEAEKVVQRKVSWAGLPRVDSLHMEAGKVSITQSSHSSKISWGRILSLAFQSIGVIYGDIGTSPLYVYASTFTDGTIDNKDDLLGVLSLIVYTIALIPMTKYVFIVLWANDNGDGGTFALYSLLCRNAKLSLIPNQQPEDAELSNYTLDTQSGQLRAQKIKQMLENSKASKIILFLVTIMGTSMVIGDGVLTPSISVLSAVSGIKSLGQDVVVGVSVAILVCLFCAQRFGTNRVGFTFAPIIVLWFSFIGGIGLYNLFKYDIGVLRAFNPAYIIYYFKRNGSKAWVSLGGIFLCITGSEAMFADLGHFNVRAVQLSFSFVTFPALAAAYIGQASFLSRFPEKVGDTFYSSIPGPLYWPVFVLAVLASIIASQAMITGTFSIISQSLALGCFPRVKVVHTSPKYEGQVYIPEANYMLMIACVIVTAAFKTTENIGHAYGIAVVTVMLITTCMVTIIMLIIWKTSIWLIALFFLVFGSIEVMYFSAMMYKFTHGGYLPLAFSACLMTVMWIWHYVHKGKYMYELNNKVSNDYVRELAANTDVNRIPGIGLLFSELVQGITPIFPHFVSSIPSIHSIFVFVSIKSLPISRVVQAERFLFRQVGPKEQRMFRCVVRYGYRENFIENQEFERQLIENLKSFIQDEYCIDGGKDPMEANEPVNSEHPALVTSERGVHPEEVLEQPNLSRNSSNSIHSISAVRSRNSSNRFISGPTKGAEEEMQCVDEALKRGIVYFFGESEVVAEPKSSYFNKMVVNYAYSFLRRNFRNEDQVLVVPNTKLLRIGMTYEI